MIENDHQLSVTKQRREEFLEALSNLKSGQNYSHNIVNLQINAISSQIETFDREIKTYTMDKFILKWENLNNSLSNNNGSYPKSKSNLVTDFISDLKLIKENE